MQIDYAPPSVEGIPLREKFTAWLRAHAGALAEIGLILVWALWVGRELLNFDPAFWPLGREYNMAVSTHHFWTNVKDCGLCALWNGSQLGGYPALTNTYAGILHPILAAATLLWGVVNGSKVVILVSLMFVGVAQWWLARELGLGWLARLWSALLAVVGGHFAGKLELGLVSMVLAIAMASLVFGAVLRLHNRRSRGAVVLLAVVTASAALAGQGYMQLGLALTAPALLVLLLDENWRLRPAWKSYAAAAVLAVLLAGVFLVPLLHHWGDVGKDGSLDYVSLQPLKYSLLNYVIDDYDFHKVELLQKWASPNLYIAYIGWLPLALAVLGLGMHAKEDRTRLFYLLAAWLFVVLPLNREFLNRMGESFTALRQFRFPNYIFSLSVPLVIALAAYGLERLYQQVPWPVLSLSSPEGKERPGGKLAFSLALVLLVPALLNVRSAYRFSSNWFQLRQGIDLSAPLEFIESRLASDEWFTYPLSEQFWAEEAARRGLKATGAVLPFFTHDKTFPEPLYEIRRDLYPEGELPAGSELVYEFDGVFIYFHPGNIYAGVTAGGEFTPCRARGTGGTIRVECNAPAAGTLVVRENYFPGWRADAPGGSLPLKPGRWLSVAIGAGRQTVEFSYRPWDFWVGLAMTLAGAGLCIWYLRRR